MVELLCWPGHDNLGFPKVFLRSASKIIVFLRFWDDFCLGSDGLLHFSFVFLRFLIDFIDFYIFRIGFYSIS